MCEISVIIPVYKAEATLRRCVNSLLAQTYHNFEIILVDDGSPDKSGDICNQYACIDNRVRVIHKDNGGVSSARQIGINVAKGKYIIHADSDDWVDPNMLEELYIRMQLTQADLVICDYILELPGKSKYIKQAPSHLDPNTLFRQCLRGEIQAMLWNKLIRKSCYNDVCFPIDIDFGEDLFVLGNMLRFGTIKKIDYVQFAFFHYNKTGEYIITNTITPKILNAQIFLTDYFEHRLPFADYKDEIFSLKYRAKQMALELGTFSQKRFVALYHAINPNIKIDYHLRNYIPSCCLYFSVRGYYRGCVLLLRFWRLLMYLFVHYIK